MKLTNLLLTGLVALALGACSSSDDATKATTEKGNAVFSFSIAMPAGTSSRADSYTTADGAVGTPEENALTNVAIKVVYTDADASKTAVNKTFVRNDFEATPTTDGNYVVYTLKDANKFEVAPGAATVYAVVNGAMPTDLAAGTTAVAEYTGTSLTGVSAGGTFAMSGKTSQFTTAASATANSSITEAALNTATIHVDRIVAKISEVTTTKSYTFAFGDKQLTMSLQDYTLLNLNKASYVFAPATFAPYVAGGYAYGWAAANNNNYDYTAAAVTKNAIGTAPVSYCYENGSTAANVTKVVYAVNIKDPNAAAGTNLYLKGGVLYTWAELNAAFDNVYSATWKLTDAAADNVAESTYEDCLKAGLVKYTRGVSYFVKDIKTGTGDAATSKIVRNNWYKLAVTNISGLGSPVVDPKEPSDPTLLTLKIYVNPWTVNANDFDLK